VFYLSRASLFVLCVFGVFSTVCVELSVPVQVIACKDSSPKWRIMCWVGCKTLLTHSLVSPIVRCIVKGNPRKTLGEELQLSASLAQWSKREEALPLYGAYGGVSTNLFFGARGTLGVRIAGVCPPQCEGTGPIPLEFLKKIYLYEYMVKPCEMPMLLSLTGTTVHTEMPVWHFGAFSQCLTYWLNFLQCFHPSIFWERSSLNPPWIDAYRWLYATEQYWCYDKAGIPLKILCTILHSILVICHLADSCETFERPTSETISKNL